MRERGKEKRWGIRGEGEREMDKKEKEERWGIRGEERERKVRGKEERVI